MAAVPPGFKAVCDFAMEEGMVGRRPYEELWSGRYCSRCDGYALRGPDGADHPYYCPVCDEDLYGIETYALGCEGCRHHVLRGYTVDGWTDMEHECDLHEEVLLPGSERCEDYAGSENPTESDRMRLFSDTFRVGWVMGI